nr:MAG TPA: hypothetical protein [Caudoviricetes sp.]
MMERFIREYANYQKKNVSNILVNEEHRKEAVRRIDRAVKAREKDLVTVDETIKMILACCGDNA